MEEHKVNQESDNVGSYRRSGFYAVCSSRLLRDIKQGNNLILSVLGNKLQFKRGKVKGSILGLTILHCLDY